MHSEVGAHKKGAATRERIVDRAFRLATRDGLEGLSIGGLAADLGISKSGLFAHFGSKTELQLAVLRAAVARFEAVVIRPALAPRPGEPRIRMLFEHWLDWASDPKVPGGCLLLAAAIELDDRPGPLRDFLVGTQKEWLATLTRAASLAVEVGHFRPDLDTEQFAFEWYGIDLGYHHAKRLMQDSRAEARARAAFERLIASARP